MSDNIMNGDAFYTLREPAWHRLGFVSAEEMGAVAAFSHINPWTVTLEPLTATINGITFQTSTNGIFRHPLPGDDEFKLLGVVGEDYRLIDPLMICELYDENVKAPVETMGALGNGETFFLTTKLPKFDVKGDEVENYMLTISPYTGGEALSIRVTPVRVVCQNTLMAAKKATSESYRIRHDDAAKENLGAWMGQLMGRVEKKTTELRDTFVKMAETRVSENVAENIVNRIYADPNLPGNHPDLAVMTRRMQDYEWYLNQAKLRRQQVIQVYKGAGVGQDTKAAAGTAWGLFNSVCELEQYRTRSVAAGLDMIAGDRAKIAERAFLTIEDFLTRPLDYASLVPTATLQAS